MKLDQIIDQDEPQLEKTKKTQHRISVGMLGNVNNYKKEDF